MTDQETPTDRPAGERPGEDTGGDLGSLPSAPQTRSGMGHPLARVLIVVGVNIVLANLAALVAVALLGREKPGDFESLVSEVSTRGEVFAVVSALAAPATWAFVVFVRRFIDRRSFSSLGFPPPGWAVSGKFFRGVLRGVVVGFAAVTLVVLAGLACGVFQRMELAATDTPVDPFLGLSPVALAGLLALAFFLQGGTEELMVRGYVQGNMMEWRESRGSWRASAIWVLLFPSFLFGGLHVLNPEFGLWPMANTMLIGVILAVWVLHDGHLGSAIGFHAAWNYTMAAIYGLPLSGIETPGLWPLTYSDSADSHLVAAFGGGRHGGLTYGPEGGWGLTVVLAVGVALALKPVLRGRYFPIPSRPPRA